MKQLTTLGKYYDVRDGTHDSPKYVKEGFPLVTSKNLKKGNIDLSKVNFISQEDFIQINKRSKVNKGDILMAMIGTIGNPVIVKETPLFAIKNVALFKINNQQDSSYLRYFLMHPATLSKLKNDAKGTTQKFVGLNYLRDFPISIPSLNEQRIIVEKIDSAFVVINKSLSIAENKLLIIDKLKNSILNFFLNQQNFEYKKHKIGELCDFNYGKGLKKEDRLKSDGYPAFGANGVKYFSKYFLFDKPSIIVGRKGSAGAINKVKEPFWALDVSYFLTIKKEIVDIDFLFYLLEAIDLPSMAKGIKPGINRNEVYEKNVLLPSLANQKITVQKLDTIFCKLNTVHELISQTIFKFEVLKSSIIERELSVS